MNPVGQFFIQYFVLLCLSIVMIINAVAHFSLNKRISICTIIITAFSLILAVSFYVSDIGKEKGWYYLVMTLSILGYSIRPACIYFFILMNKRCYRGKFSFLLWVPLVLNCILYLCAYIPGTKDIIFGFEISTGGRLVFGGGPLRFSSHIMSLCYLLYLIYISIFTLKSKHIMHGVTILICSAFVITAVVIESFFNPDGKVELLNTTIMVSTFTYYLFLYKESMSIDTLTGLFNRETYYRDVSKMFRTTTGVISFDINGLKYINDNFGHHEGDKCIASIANTINSCLKRSMYAYRLGGDEFLVIANNTNEKAIEDTVNKFKEKIEQSEYHCSVGYALKTKEMESIDDVIKEAEKNMYADKNDFYRSSKLERRKS